MGMLRILKGVLVSLSEVLPALKKSWIEKRGWRPCPLFSPRPSSTLFGWKHFPLFPGRTEWQSKDRTAYSYFHNWRAQRQICISTFLPYNSKVTLEGGKFKYRIEMINRTTIHDCLPLKICFILLICYQWKITHLSWIIPILAELQIIMYSLTTYHYSVYGEKFNYPLL